MKNLKRNTKVHQCRTAELNHQPQLSPIVTTVKLGILGFGLAHGESQAATMPQVVTKSLVIKWSRALVAAAAICCLSLFANSAYAATFNVTCTNQALISAIDSANTNGEADTINLPNNCVFSLSNQNNLSPRGGANGLPVITSEITIVGNNSIIERAVDATDKFRFFQVDVDGDLSLNQLTLRAGVGVDGIENIVGLDGFFFGSAPGGGSILTAGDLDLFNVDLLNNRPGNGSPAEGAVSAGGGPGGAISSFGESNVSIVGSIIDGNQTGDAFFDHPPGGGGALSIRGASIIIDRSTISNNRIGSSPQPFSAASATIISALPSTSFRLVRSTLSGNGLGQNEEGIFFNSGSLSNVEISQNTFFNNNSGARLLSINVLSNAVTIRNNLFEQNGSSCFVSSGDLNIAASTGNLFDDASSNTACGLSSANGNITNVIANVLPLDFNGGRTPTHDLPANSPARDRIQNPISELRFDQRGSINFGQDGEVSRSSTPVDVGAVEAITVNRVTDNFMSTGNVLATGVQQFWYSVELQEGESIEYTVNFSNASGNVNTALFLKDQLLSRNSLAFGLSTNDDETIEFTASETDEYWFRVFGFRSATNTFDLNVRVNRNEFCVPIKANNGNIAVICL